MKINNLFVALVFTFLLIPEMVIGESFAFDLLNLRNTHPEYTEAYLSSGKLLLEDTWNKLNDNNISLTPIKIGIIDNPIDASHSEFDGKLVGTNMVGKVNFGNSPAWALSPHPLLFSNEEKQHGIGVVGIIGANNLSGHGFILPSSSPQMNGVLSGVSSLDYTLEIRSPYTQVTTFFNDIIRIEELRQQNVSIINLSRGSKVGGSFLKRKIENNPDILFVVAAGNDGIDASAEMPAKFGNELANVITVGSVNNNDERAIFLSSLSSNFGSSVNISAPGVNFYMPAVDGAYQINSGTSLSAPLVTGVAGLLKAIKSELTPTQIKQILIRTADPIQTGETDKRLGTGCYTNPNDPVNTGCRLNALAAVCDPEVGLNCAPSSIVESDATTMVGTAPAVVLSYINPAWTADLDGLHDPLKNDGTSDGSQWIWATDGPTHPETEQTYVFEKRFTLNAIPVSSTLYFAVDNHATIRLNGHLIADSIGFAKETEGVYLVPPEDFILGENILSITATNDALTPDPQANPAGILFKLVEGTNTARTLSAPAQLPIPSVGALTVTSFLGE